jgi:monovalent cation:H+ antiporter-2, CPA2 family
MISLSIVLKTLASAGVTTTLASRVMIGLLVVQDLAVIPMLIILPQLANLNGILAKLARSTAVAVLFLLVLFALGTRLERKSSIRRDSKLGARPH